MIGAFILSATFAPQISPIPYVISGAVNGFLGIVIQLIVIPILIKFIVTNKEASKIIEVN